MKLKRIKLNPPYPSQEYELHPDDVDYPSLAFMVQPDFAVVADGALIALAEVEPDPDEAGAYKQVGDQIIVAADDKRTVAGLAETVQQLKGFSAWELLTERYDTRAHHFHLNRPRGFWLQGADGPPIKELRPDGSY